MKLTLRILLSLSVAFATAAQAQTFLVTVNGGYGGGLFAPGDTVHVWANAPSSGVTFDRWTGDVGTMLFDTREWHARLIMPAAPVNLTADTKTYTPFTWVEEQIMGRDRLKQVFYYIPPMAKGVVTCYHGTNGQGESWVGAQTENAYVTQYLVANGYGVVVTEAEEVTTGMDADNNGALRWLSTTLSVSANVDLANLQIILQDLTSRGKIAVGAPLFALGMSNGSSFAATVSAALNMRASAGYCSDGPGLLYGSPSFTVPRQFHLAQNDQNPEVSNTDALANHQLLLGRGVATEYRTHPRQPILPNRLMRIGLSLSQGQDVIARLKTAGIVSSTNYVQAGYNTTVAASALSPTYVSKLNDIRDQLDICAADHKFYSDYAYKTLAFFDAHLPVTANEDPTAAATTELRIYPQPTRGDVWVGAAPGSIRLAPARQLTVRDLLGHVVYSTWLAAGVDAHLMDASTWPAGLYVVQLGDRHGRLIVGR